MKKEWIKEGQGNVKIFIDGVECIIPNEVSFHILYTGDLINASNGSGIVRKKIQAILIQSTQ